MIAERLLLQIEVNNKQAIAGFKNTESRLKFLNQQVNALKGGMMSFGLSALFTGMALKRLGQTILTSLVKTYMQATDEQSRFNQQILAVQASFEFLKFSIMDALGNSELVVKLIEGFIEVVNWVSEFVNKHPMIAKVVGLFLILAIVVGTIGMFVGQMVLAMLGFIGLTEILGITGGALMLTLGSYILVIVAALLVVSAVIIALESVWSNANLSIVEQWAGTVAAIGLGAGIILLLFGATTAGLVGLFVGAVAAMIFLWEELKNTTKTWAYAAEVEVSEFLINTIGKFATWYSKISGWLKGLLNALALFNPAARIASRALWEVEKGVNAVAAGAIEELTMHAEKAIELGKLSQAQLQQGLYEKLGIGSGAAGGVAAGASNAELVKMARQLNGVGGRSEMDWLALLSGGGAGYTGIKGTPSGFTAPDLSSQIDSLKEQQGALDKAQQNNNVTVNIENMVADDSTMKNLFDKYIKDFLEDMNNRFAGTTRGA